LKVLLIVSAIAAATAGPVVYAPDAYQHSAPAVYSHAAPVATYAAPAYKTVSYAAPAAVYAPTIVKKVVAAAPEPYDPNPSYNFNYGVSDPHTGDSKTAEEHLENGVVHGSYSFTEADGTIRKVTYTADDHHGFNANVEKIGEPAPAPIVKKIVAAPVYAAPAYHAAPIVKQYVAAAPAHYHH
jgi:hypothetical protein